MKIKRKEKIYEGKEIKNFWGFFSMMIRKFACPLFQLLHEMKIFFKEKKFVSNKQRCEWIASSVVRH